MKNSLLLIVFLVVLKVIFAQSVKETTYQTIELSEGYQFVSTFLQPANTNLINIVDELLNGELDFIRNSEGALLQKIGNEWINGIGNVYPGEGYLIKLSDSDTLIYPSLQNFCPDILVDPRDNKSYPVVQIGNHLIPVQPMKVALQLWAVDPAPSEVVSITSWIMVLSGAYQ